MRVLMTSWQHRTSAGLRLVMGSLVLAVLAPTARADQSCTLPWVCNWQSSCNDECLDSSENWTTCGAYGVCNSCGTTYQTGYSVVGKKAATYVAWCDGREIRHVNMQNDCGSWVECHEVTVITIYPGVSQWCCNAMGGCWGYQSC